MSQAFDLSKLSNGELFALRDRVLLELQLRIAGDPTKTFTYPPETKRAGIAPAPVADSDE